MKQGIIEINCEEKRCGKCIYKKYTNPLSIAPKCFIFEEFLKYETTDDSIKDMNDVNQSNTFPLRCKRCLNTFKSNEVNSILDESDGDVIQVIKELYGE